MTPRPIRHCGRPGRLFTVPGGETIGDSADLRLQAALQAFRMKFGMSGGLRTSGNRDVLCPPPALRTGRSANRGGSCFPCAVTGSSGNRSVLCPPLALRTGQSANPGGNGDYSACSLGRVNQKVEPSPSRDSTPMRPPSDSTIDFEIASPMPTPCLCDPILTKRLNSCC